jgi:hypothetical protein
MRKDGKNMNDLIPAEIIENKLVCHFGTPFKSLFGGSLPFAFTEHGILMLSSILNSKKAIQVNIRIMRIFSRLREMISSHKDLSRKIEKLENKYSKHDFEIQEIFKAIKCFIEPPYKPLKKIGFIVDRENQ